MFASQQVQLARENLARLRAHSRVLIVEPVPYEKVHGTGFYQQFIDTSQWPEFMLAGRAATRAAVWSLATQGTTATGRATGDGATVG